MTGMHLKIQAYTAGVRMYF